MEKVLDFIKNKRSLAAIGIGCLILGTMLPYIKLNFYFYSTSLSLWGYWQGKIIILLAVLHMLFLFKDYIKKYVPQMFNNNFSQKIMELNNPKLSLIPTALTVVLVVTTHVRLFDDSYSKEYIKYGFGFWLIIIGVIFLIAHCFVYKGNANVLDSNPGVPYAPNPADNMNMQNGMNQANNVNMQNGMNQPNNMNMQNGMNQPNNMNMQNGMNQPNNMNMQNGMDQANNMNMQNGMNQQNNLNMSNGINQVNNANDMNGMNQQNNLNTPNVGNDINNNFNN